jgi:hypothetical protein
MISNLRCGEFSSNTSNDEIACCASSNFVGHMAGHMKLTICPAELELCTVRYSVFESSESNTYTLHVHVDVVAFGIGEEICCALDKRYSSGAVIPDKDVQESTTTNDTS